MSKGYRPLEQQNYLPFQKPLSWNKQQRNLAGEEKKEEQKEEKKEEKIEDKGEQKEEKKDPPKEEDDIAAKIKEAANTAAAAALKAYQDEEERKRKEKEAADNNDYKSLYEAEKAKLQAVEDEKKKFKDSADNYAKRMNAVVEAGIKDWPASIKKSDPGNTNVDARVLWMENMMDAAKELMAKTEVQHEHGEQGKGSGKSGERNVVKDFVNNRYGDLLPEKGKVGQ